MPINGINSLAKHYKMQESEIILKAKRIQIRANYLVTDIFAGEYKSAFKGRGLEFEEVRPYQAGDDTRHIDWNITARFGQPFVKIFREERELTVMLLVDVSSSTLFGTTGSLKKDLATELAATLAYVAAKSNDKVGLILFADQVLSHIPPKKGAAHIFKIIRKLLDCKIQQKKTDIAAGLDFLMKILRRRAVCFIISDFMDEGYHESLAIAGRKHEFIGFIISDEREEFIPRLGLMAFKDAETGATLWVNSKKTKFQDKHSRLVQDASNNLISLLNSQGVDAVKFKTGQSITKPLLRYFRQRGKKA